MMLRQPFWLLLLVPAAALIALSLARRAYSRVSPVHNLKTAARTWRVCLWWLPEILTGAFLITAVILVAGPERQLPPDSESGEGLAIVLAFDRSSSMSAVIPYDNSRIRRIDGVKLITRDFLSKRKNDQFALISFARYPETNTPLTGNKSILLDFLNLIDVPATEDEDGTAIGDALVLAAAHMGTSIGGETPKRTDADQKKRKGVIILLTDGQNNRGEKTPAEGAGIAAAAGATVYTIGLGGEGYLMQDTPSGKREVGVPVAIDEVTLDAIARKTGGRYYRANSLADLSVFYQDIAKRETVKLDQARTQKTELDLEGGLRLLLGLLFATVTARYLLLRRRDS